MKPPTSRSGEGRAAFERGGRRKRYEEIVDHVQLMIFSGALGIGDQLPSERELMDRFGVAATARASFVFYNTRQEVDRLVDGIHKVTEIFNR